MRKTLIAFCVLLTSGSLLAQTTNKTRKPAPTKKQAVPAPAPEEATPSFEEESSTAAPTKATRATKSNHKHLTFTGIWQPEGGEVALQPRLAYSTATANFSGSISNVPLTASVTANDFSPGLGLSVGLNESFAIGADLSWSSNTLKTKVTALGISTESTSKYEGLSNPSIFMRARSDFNKLSLLYGLNAGISPAAQTYDSTSGNYNNFSGGHSLSPYLGLKMEMGKWLLAPTVSYKYQFERTRKTTPANTETKYTGGHNLTVGLINEFVFDNFQPGFYLEYRKEEKTESNGVTTSPNSSQFAAAIYGALKLSPSFSLVPILAYSRPVLENPTGATGDWTADSYIAAVEARITF